MSVTRWIRNRIRGNKLYKRIAGRYVATAIVICVTLFYYQQSISDTFTDSYKTVAEGPSFRPSSFYYSLFEAFTEYEPLPRPSIELLRDNEKCRMGDISKSPDQHVMAMASYENLHSCMHLSEEQLYDLKTKHARFVEILHTDLRLSSMQVDKLWPNEKGIVTIGGGRFSVISISMLETLREMGSTLPVEVIIPPEDEGDDDYCNKVLPALNAKCVFFSDVLPKDLTRRFKFQRYQYKLIGLLISSFKKVLFLDADDLPLKNMDGIFDEVLFKERGLILWPDMWRRATTPAFYEVAGIEYDLTKRVRYFGDDISPVSRYHNPASPPNLLTEVPMHDLKGFMPDPSSESGQVLIDKAYQLSTLLLSTYYNVHSAWYYKMLSQGTPGEGDKETFLAAACALKMPHYQVRTGLSMDGFTDYNKDYHGISLYQHNFQQDHEQHERAKKYVEGHLDQFSSYDPTYDYERDFTRGLMKPRRADKVEVLFAHVGYHKFDPIQMAAGDVYLDKEKNHFRGFRRYDILRGFDLELFNFKAYQRHLCPKDGNPVDLKCYREKANTQTWKDMCTYLNGRVEFLEDTHSDYLEKTRQALDRLGS